MDALESSYAVLQTAASPLKLHTDIKLVHHRGLEPLLQEP
jgi:hypothetical protein